MADSSVFTTDLGAVTAYADAKAHGYTGTREEFGTLLANAGTNLAEANAMIGSLDNLRICFRSRLSRQMETDNGTQ